MNRDLFESLKSNSLFEQLPETLKELWSSAISALEEALDTGVVIAEAATQEITEVEAPE